MRWFEQVLSKGRHHLMRFHRPAELKLKRWQLEYAEMRTRPTGGARFFSEFFKAR